MAGPEDPAKSAIADHAEARGCRCGLWKTNPGVLEREGLPRGYCGFCGMCGKLGHTRRFPGVVNTRGAWCDRHYGMIRWFNPFGQMGCLLWLVGTAAVVAFFLWIGGVFG